MVKVSRPYQFSLEKNSMDSSSRKASILTPSEMLKFKLSPSTSVADKSII